MKNRTKKRMQTTRRGKARQEKRRMKTQGEEEIKEVFR